MELKSALKELRKTDKRNFEQSFDLIINFKGIDLRRDGISTIANIPYPFKDKKVCGFLTKRSELIKTITQPDFVKYKDKKILKNMVKEYDFFIGVSQLMPAVATNFGKVLGPSGRMPTPQLGIIVKDDEESIKQALDKIKSTIRIKLKETSFKVSVGKENMKDEEIAENINSIYNSLVSALPNKKENVKSVMLKLTMSKPIRAEI